MPRFCRCKPCEGQKQALVALLQEPLGIMACVRKFDSSAGNVVRSQSPESKLHTCTRNINIDMILIRVISGTTQNFLRRRKKTPNTI